MKWSRLALPAYLTALLLAGSGSLRAGELSGEIAVEGRLFPQSALGTGLFSRNVSLALEPEWYAEWDGRRQSLVLVPFFRWDQHDPERSHWDVRELSWLLAASDFELRVGVRRVFWGVTESKHLVDIINQTDLTEDIDGESKLGQPMVNLAWIGSWGVFDAYALVGFRERRLFGGESRPGPPVRLDVEAARFESPGKRHLAWAVRWSHSAGPWELGLHYFSGTSRDPRFVPRSDGEGLVPYYEQIGQLGLDAQMTVGGWLLKLEAIQRTGQGETFAAATGGFEYTMANLGGSGLDLGLLAEYSWDERGDEALTPLQDDVFIGTRVAMNDVQSTQLLAGVAIDRRTGATFFNLEASRRIGETWTAELRARWLAGVPEEDLFLYGVRRDGYVQLTWTRHF